MDEAYRVAIQEIAASALQGGTVLDCGANDGAMFDRLAKEVTLELPGARHLAVSARQRVVELFDWSLVTERYARLLLRLIETEPPATAGLPE